MTLHRADPNERARWLLRNRSVVLSTPRGGWLAVVSREIKRFVRKAACVCDFSQNSWDRPDVQSSHHIAVELGGCLRVTSVSPTPTTTERNTIRNHAHTGSLLVFPTSFSAASRLDTSSLQIADSDRRRLTRYSAQTGCCIAYESQHLPESNCARLSPQEALATNIDSSPEL
ncbi:hypothetical protein PHSY_002697 [Pseudozyma hubeiensis SY62]|uniref:Uncharacterized protein n=1 Tax=Pseudozyma hubeiensis (strain SY62) TaxID=1305764 RepID=R9P1T1_PSEHS|nr:hypothetical protein PHSY_002697 [Pseudozyma hubeiensis SY62]GAC95122.1 hypothetical protein PHSY_002697 [Pseudozyma hubeiensis SY62]